MQDYYTKEKKDFIGFCKISFSMIISIFLASINKCWNCLNDKKIMIELIGNERVETIIANTGWVADKSYIKELIKHANRNFVGNNRKIEEFINLIAKI